MTNYMLSPEAASSITDIGHYTSSRFGPHQVVRYLRSLRDGIEFVAEDPLRGQYRPELSAGYYSYFVESHTVYYRIKPDHIEVIDVLHQSMEPARHLKRK